MNKLLGVALLGAAFALPGCDGDAEAPAPEADETTLDAGTSAADMSPTLEGEGDMSSAAGAGAASGARDGGDAGEDGAPPVDEGAGGPSDALNADPEPAE